MRVIPLVALGVCGTGCSQPLSAEPKPESPNPRTHSALQPVLVRTVQPTREPLQRTTTQPAHVEPYERTDIYAK